MPDTRGIRGPRGPHAAPDGKHHCWAPKNAPKQCIHYCKPVHCPTHSHTHTPQMHRLTPRLYIGLSPVFKAWICTFRCASDKTHLPQLLKTQHFHSKLELRVLEDVQACPSVHGGVVWGAEEGTLMKWNRPSESNTDLRNITDYVLLDILSADIQCLP